MAVNVEIFSQGEEIITGQTVDTNSAWLATKLVTLGFKVTRHTTVGDRLDDLVALLQEIAHRADCCLCTGGLGPTSDDLTAAAVAQAFGLSLVFDPEAFAQIEAYFAQRQRSMPASNRKQAMLPQGALRLDNAWGTAPGFALQHGRCWFAFMPGVPLEMRGLFAEQVKPYLQQHFTAQPAELVIFKTFGIGESALQELLAPIALPAVVQLGFRAGTDEVQVKLLFPYGYSCSEKQRLIALYTAQLGRFAFAVIGPGDDAIDMAGVIGQLLQPLQQTVAVLETLSHGQFAAKCLGHAWLVQSQYHGSLTRLGKQWGVAYAVDEDVQTIALSLAAHYRQQSGADIALVQLACTSALEQQVPQGSVRLCTVLATATGTYSQSSTVNGTLHRQQNQAALIALDVLRHFLLDSAGIAR